jgi:hypothetical protein
VALKTVKLFEFPPEDWKVLSARLSGSPRAMITSVRPGSSDVEAPPGADGWEVGDGAGAQAATTMPAKIETAAIRVFLMTNPPRVLRDPSGLLLRSDEYPPPLAPRRSVRSGP